MAIELIEVESKGSAARGARPMGSERRGARRFSAVEDRIWLGWWDGEQFQTLGARLLDVSRTGAAVACPDGPGVGDDAWFCVVGPSLSGGARARVVGREPTEDDPSMIRLRLNFQARCPDDVYEIALGMMAEPLAR
ncbi:hypothetical protein [Tautonia plasticadhaerens]|uniref:PilZ domain-containing protein n=1 Tax=Tautonia plasticadhaerens TaxID=2527974 RepID=A0A518HAQ4_9BACT|nr:hypothetical protein [Tautonia plasticadhaerens]QDV37923.1 hypothetical protein ElP_58700 [Tautonia plasticadhaerens]